MGYEEVMYIHPDIEEFVQQLEASAKCKLNFPAEVKELLQIISQAGMANDFNELTFQAKFIVKTQEVMKRIGPGADGFQKLSGEFQSNVKKVLEILNKFISRAPDNIKRKFNSLFITTETECFNRFLKLLYDFSIIKNWQLDGGLLPAGLKPAFSDQQYNQKNSEHISVLQYTLAIP